MNLFSSEHTSSGIFMLQSLNPTIGVSGESYVNSVTHTRSRGHTFFEQRSEDEVVNGYQRDFRSVFGRDLRTHPSVVSTGTALKSGVEAANAVIGGHR